MGSMKVKKVRKEKMNYELTGEERRFTT
ncbi:uncharacterized protein G2W53_017845 [Senna tora]|uniref:Uncharacterized protein n=1 Tax=Senna tora TaxID=362788 RepID=A0A834TTY3_9FABA|nr:uncharacterized protein G2W53_017845 [Senna tora]